ncbi:MAG: hypothetical protein ACOYM9_10010 [Bradymonadia bacterium]
MRAASFSRPRRRAAHPALGACAPCGRSFRDGRHIHRQPHHRHRPPPERRASSRDVDDGDALELRGRGAAPPPPPPRVSTFAYDGLGRLTSSSSPEGELNYAYAYPEPDGRLQVTTSGAISEVRNFDALGRVSNVRRGAGPLTSFTWNLGGTLASVSALGGWF